MKNFKVEKLEVTVADSRKEMGKYAADKCEQYINELLASKEHINMVFAAAPSQNEFLESLLERDIDFSRINAFHMDEYVGLASTHNQSFGYFLTEHIFGKANFRSVNLINATAPIEEACAQYTQLLKDNPVDIVCMGIGENGHIAFNDPPVADFNDPFVIKKVELDEICRNQQVNDGCFANIDLVPKYALTLTVPALFSASKIVCTVPAITKAKATRRMLDGEISTECPATILRKHDCAHLFLDPDSASLLEE
ncbi:MAG: glucosamine-6-phosphate deaminase [Clostridia bacterium]|nr:glucosamine-6-phosphate deaminase [Clostridia bacterium]